MVVVLSRRKEVPYHAIRDRLCKRCFLPYHYVHQYKRRTGLPLTCLHRGLEHRAHVWNDRFNKKPPCRPQ